MKLQEAWRDVIRPTMRREPKTPGNRGVEVVMVDLDGDGIPDPPAPEREPITVTTGAAWSDLNDYKIGSEVFANVAAYTGGNPDTTTYRYRWQTRATADDAWVNSSWTNYDDHAMEVSTTIAEPGQLRFQCQGRDTSVDPVEQVNSFAAVKTINTPAALVVSTPVVTGDPIVGYTLTCSEPTVSGGVGPYQLDYFWVDESNAIVWEATYMGNTTTIVPYDIGKTMKCLVTVTDNGYAKGESTTVQSNQLGPINRPTLPGYEAYVDGALYDDPSAEVGVQPNETVVLEVKPEAVAYPPLDIGYSWQVRTGSGRLSGGTNGTGVMYVAPDSAPAGALVTCTASSNDAADSAYAAEVTILVAE